MEEGGRRGKEEGEGGRSGVSDCLSEKTPADGAYLKTRASRDHRRKNKPKTRKNSYHVQLQS